MATNPMLQAVMLFQHHQTTTPFMPAPGVAPPDAVAGTADMAKPKEEKPEKDDTEENDEEEKSESDDEKEGEEHGEEH